MIVALHSTLKPGAETDYIENHQQIPADLADSFTRYGIHDWTIWRSGRHLFHLVDCDDFAAAMSALANDPADQRWQSHIGVYVEGFIGTNGVPEDDPDRRPLDRLFSLRTQLQVE